MSCCCFIQDRMCNPSTGEQVDVLTDYESQVRTAYNPTTMEPYLGDIDALVLCNPGDGGTVIVNTVDRFDIDYCTFSVGASLPPRLAYCSGITTVGLTALTPPIGGDETYQIYVNGVAAETLVLSAGNTTVYSNPFGVNGGDQVELVMVSSTAVQPSSGGSARFIVECNGATDPGGGGGTTTCAITSQPTSVSGTTGTTVSFGGTASGGIQWQTFSGGSWVNATPPTTITAANDGSQWRFCCIDNAAVCSNVATITVSTVACAITSQPVSVTGNIGDTMSFGGTASGAIQWQVLDNGTWFDAAAPTTITDFNNGSSWRFCCVEDPTVCSDIVTITGTSNIFDPTVATGTVGTQGNNITDENGNRIAGGGANAAINQRTSP